MKLEPNRTYKTRSGEDALIYAVDAPGQWPIHGRIGSHVCTWTADGRVQDGAECPSDLILPEPPRVSLIVYANVWPKGVDVYRTESGAATDAAALNFKPLRIAVPCMLTEIVP